MKLEVCIFSGYKIYPGRGRKLVRFDGKVVHFLSSKTESLYLQRKNPRKISWTVLYRRKYRKGTIEEVQKKRRKKATKFNRSVFGADIAEIEARRKEKPEVRKALRDEAVKKAKKAKEAKKAEKKNRRAQPRQAQQQKAAQKVAGKGR
eukprot:Clim_evm43s152 gene=Clim_evmTU43s152